MQQKFTFQPHFQINTAPTGETVYLLSEKRNYALHGRIFVLLTPYLKKGASGEEILNTLSPFVKETQISSALQYLLERDYITGVNSFTSRSGAAFWSQLGTDEASANAKLRGVAVSVINVYNGNDDACVRTLQDLGIQIAEHGDLSLVLADDYLNPALHEINSRHLASKTPWMLVKPIGSQIWIGPIFIPETTGCWQCLAHRLRGHRRLKQILATTLQPQNFSPLSIACLPATQQAAFSLAATELAKWIVFERAKIVGNVLSFDFESCESQKHVLVRRPQCDSCHEQSYEESPEVEPLTLRSRTKSFTEDGGHRIFSPEEAVNRITYHISPITGILSEVKRLTDPTFPFSVYMASYNYSEKVHDLKWIRTISNAQPSGKGRASVQSKASAIFEAIERYCWQWHGDERYITASMNDLGDQAIHPNSCMLFSTDQYQRRQDSKTAAGNTAYIPEPFEQNAPIKWIPVWSLTDQRLKYLPLAFCYVIFQGTLPRQYSYCIPDSNGLAAGNVIEEAILQGFFELVERDCIALWWYNKLPRPSIDLESLPDPYFTTMRQYYQSLEREMWLLDLTSDFQIPACVAISSKLQSNSGEIIMGFGCHFDPKLAMQRAVTELNQMLCNLQRSKGVYGGGIYAYLKNWLEGSNSEDHPYLLPESNAPSKTLNDFQNFRTSDLKDDIEECIARATQKGMEILVCNLTRPDVNVPVVKVVVPGMRPVYPRFAPGRLYDVPVRMGWLQHPLQEFELNPVQVPI